MDYQQTKVIFFTTDNRQGLLKTIQLFFSNEKIATIEWINMVVEILIHWFLLVLIQFDIYR